MSESLVTYISLAAPSQQLPSMAPPERAKAVQFVRRPTLRVGARLRAVPANWTCPLFPTEAAEKKDPEA